MGEWVVRIRLAQVVDLAGFIHDPMQDIIVSKLDPCQRYAGYNRAHDAASPLLHMIIDCEPFYFDYAGHAWLIEPWRVSTAWSAGPRSACTAPPAARPAPGAAEGAAPGLPARRPGPADDELHAAQERLARRRHPAASRPGAALVADRLPPGRVRGEYARADDEAGDRFPGRRQADQLPFTTPRTPGAGRGLRDAFLASVRARGYAASARGALGVAFTFDRPRSMQPETRLRLERSMQEKNHKLVLACNALRRALDIPDNDPNAFDQLGGTAGDVIQTLKDGAAKVREGASSLAAKSPAKPAVGAKLGSLPAAGKARAAASAAAAKVQGTAAAAAGQLLGGLPDGSRAAYDTLVEVHDRKLWHVQAVGREARA